MNSKNKLLAGREVCILLVAAAELSELLPDARLPPLPPPPLSPEPPAPVIIINKTIFCNYNLKMQYNFYNST
jgi:hypothetical protein